MKRFFFITALLLTCALIPLDAQIEKVMISWNPLLCADVCTNLLTKQLYNVQGVAGVAIDSQSGYAEMTWKRNASFSFSQINSAFRLVGISLRDIRVRAQGLLQHTDRKVVLISSGDNTRFDLLNPIVPNPKGQVVVNNLESRALTKELRQKLLDGEKEKKFVTIEGPLFMPERNYYPAELVVDQLTFSDKEKSQTK